MGDRGILWEVGLLDVIALVSGAAIAGAHVRLAVPEPRGGAWVWAVALFGLLAVTASGPFLLLVRIVAGRGPGGRSRVGDRLWAVWGSPWVAAALVEATKAGKATEPGRLDAAYVGSLGLGLFLATMVGVPLLAARSLWGDPAARRRDRGETWSERVGLALAATWPIQCGVGLVLIG